jgi:hypothetical protein
MLLVHECACHDDFDGWREKGLVGFKYLRKYRSKIGDVRGDDPRMTLGSQTTMQVEESSMCFSRH